MKRVKRFEGILTQEETEHIYLHDDDTPFGGTSFGDETLYEFLKGMEGYGYPSFAWDMEEVNETLKQCGIEELYITEHKGDIGSYLNVNHGEVLLFRKEFFIDGFIYKSIDNFHKYIDTGVNLPVYSAENDSVIDYTTAEELIALTDRKKDLALKLLIDLDWQYPETLWEEWQREDNN